MHWRIRIMRLNWNLTEAQKLSVRVWCATQDEAENVANCLLTEWLLKNPGLPATWSVSGLSAKELGQI